MRLSSVVRPSVASTTSTATPARSIARSARRKLKYSTPRTFAGRRSPAVSTNRTGPSAHSTTASTASRVVPASSNTTERSSPTSRLNRLDLPTFGRPTSANARLVVRRPRRESLVGEHARRCGRGPPGAAPVERGNRHRLAEPEPMEGERVGLLAIGVDLVRDEERPGRATAAAAGRASASSSTGPVCASTTSTIASASAIARSAWRATCSSMPRAPWTYPPCRRAGTSARARTPRARRGRASRRASRERSRRGCRRAGSRGSTCRRSGGRRARRRARRGRSSLTGGAGRRARMARSATSRRSSRPAASCRSRRRRRGDERVRARVARSRWARALADHGRGAEPARPRGGRPAHPRVGVRGRASRSHRARPPTRCLDPRPRHRRRSARAAARAGRRGPRG